MRLSIFVSHEAPFDILHSVVLYHAHSAAMQVRSVGKGASAPCPPFFESNVFALLVGTPPDALAPGRFAHPTAAHAAKPFFETVRNWVRRNCSGRIGLDRTPAGCEQNRPCWIDRGFRP